VPEVMRTVIKVGGSLYDRPSLGSDLRRFLPTLHATEIAIFPGGGKFADLIRDLDRSHELGEERSHWLAVRSLSLAARFLVDLLTPKTTLVSTLSNLEEAWGQARVGVVDPLPFARSDALRKTALPRTWDVTSDSLALRLCNSWHLDRLILLKSATPAANWLESESDEIVDAHFRKLLCSLRKPPEVTVVNLLER
jgi:5-(aminomethyl)-3-furanmethanol phosphate kinase